MCNFASEGYIIRNMSKFINPFTDIGFKRIFGQEISKPVLIAFLNALLSEERTIVDVKFLDKEQLVWWLSSTSTWATFPMTSVPTWR